MKILIFALSGIGDALMFTPALRLLRESYPNARIDALCMFKGVKDIYADNPNLSNTYYFNMMKEGMIKSSLYLLKFIGRYDISINVYPSNRKEYNLLSFLVLAKKRASVRYLRLDRENLGFLNNVTIEENDSLHNVEENVKLVEQLTGRVFSEIPPLELNLGQKELGFADKYLEELGIERNELVIGFHPGCSTLKNHINRRWEPQKFSELGKMLIQELNARILVFGGPEEAELKNTVHQGIGSDKSTIVEAESLAHSAAVMKRCNLFITNDSSLMHVASALQIKTLAIIGPTNINYIRPWRTEHKIVSLHLDCAPCFFYSPRPLECKRTDLLYKCVKEITPRMVFDQSRDFIGIHL